MRIAKNKASRYEKAAREAEEEIKDQKSIISQGEMTVHIQQQDILKWIALTEWYQSRCLQCSDILGQMMAFLQENPTELT